MKSTFGDFLLPRLAAITVRGEFGGREVVNAISGFIVEIEEHWFLITAGHILAELDKELSMGARITESYIYDCWEHLGEALPVPFNYPESVRTYINGENDTPLDGVDVGLILIPPMLRRTLAAGSIRPFRPEEWHNPPNMPERIAVIGLPSELNKPFMDGATLNLTVQPTVVYLDPCEEPPQMRKAVRRLYGRLRAQLGADTPDGPMLHNLKGLSGGPVVAMIRENGGWRYWLIGIQSAFHEEPQVLAFFPFDNVATAIHRLLTGQTIDEPENLAPKSSERGIPFGECGFGAPDA